jgi:hypothetical protein
VIATAAIADELELVGWRREVAGLYAAVRQASSPQDGHALWRANRDRLFQEHPQSPLVPDDSFRGGLPCAAYEPTLRRQLTIQPAADNRCVMVQTAPGESTARAASETSRSLRRSTPRSWRRGLSGTGGCRAGLSAAHR